VIGKFYAISKVNFDFVRHSRRFFRFGVSFCVILEALLNHIDYISTNLPLFCGHLTFSIVCLRVCNQSYNNISAVYSAIPLPALSLSLSLPHRWAFSFIFDQSYKDNSWTMANSDAQPAQTGFPLKTINFLFDFSITIFNSQNSAVCQ